MTREELLSFPIEDLKDMADSMGLAFAAGAAVTAEQYADKIMAAETPELVEDAPKEMVFPPFKTSATIAADYAAVIDDVPHAPTATQTGVLPDPEARKYLPNCTPENVRSALAAHVRRGMEIVSLTDTGWHLRMANKEDSGNMAMPLKSLVQCANMLMVQSAVPTEGEDIDVILEQKRKAIR